MGKNNNKESVEYAKKMIRLIDEKPNCIIEEKGIKYPAHIARMGYEKFIKENGKEDTNS